ncbi:hypothetical protein HK102_011647, partial [Quaeritorhiza haematococci]
WSNDVQKAQFFQKFAKTVNTAIEQYCDAIALGEIKDEAAANATGWTTTFTSITGAAKTPNGPKDIANESCIKLCNVEYAMTRLDEMYRLMNVASLTDTQRNFRATMAPIKKGRLQAHAARKAAAAAAAAASGSSSANADSDTVSGQFKIQILYAENVKPCNKNGLANPYVVVKVPEGTVVPPADDDTDMTGAGSATDTTTSNNDSGAANGSSRPPSSGSATNASGTTSPTPAAPTVLTGKDCELARSRVVYDSLNATYDEVFQCILPPVSLLDVSIFSKNLITSDELAGKASIDLGRGTRLKRKLGDHHTHDV